MKYLQKKITTSLGFLLVCSSLSAQQTFINKEWEKSNGQPGQYDQISSALDPSGNLVYISNHLNNSSNTDIFLSCIHPNGNVAWQQTCPSSVTQDDYGADLKIDASGNIYVTGAHHNGNNLDYFVAKYDQMGALLWQQYYNGNANGDDVPSAIDIDASGNVYVTGTTYGGWTLTDIATIKFDNNGNQQWVKKYNFNNKVEVATDIKVDNVGNIIVLGASANNWSNSDFIVRKYNANGNVLATKRHNSPGNGYDLPTELVVDINDNIFVIGTSENNGNKDIKLIAYNTSLQVQWAKYIDQSSNTDEGYGICLDPTGNVIITGYCSKVNGGTEFLVAKYNPSTGDQLWENRRSAPIDTDIAKGRQVTTDAAGNIYAAGEVQLNGSRDFSLMSFKPNGAIRFAKDFNIFQNDHARQILQTNDDIFITGISDSASSKEATTIKVSIFDKDQPTIFCNLKPCAVDDEVLVRFEPSDLILSNVDNKGITWGIVSDFVVKTAIAEINKNLEFDIGSQKCYKVHPNLTSANTTSISRLGNTVNLPPFYATFGVIIPTGSNDSLVVHSLNLSVPHILVATINEYAWLTIGANDPKYTNGNSAGLVASGSIPNANINIEPAWDYETGDSSIIVGVYDSGIHNSHTDFSNGTFSSSSVKGGYDYINTAPITAVPNPDDYGHGSAVSGVIAAWRNNNFGIAGVAGGSSGGNGVTLNDMKIFAVNPTGCGLTGTFGATYAQIQQAIIEGATATGPILNIQDVMNHSWGGPVNPLLRDAFITTYNLEVISVVASGNGALPPPNPCNVVSYPSTFKDHMVMKVGANDSTGARASFSECGWGLDFIAPGTHNLYIGVDNSGNNFTDSIQHPNPACLDSPLDGTSLAAPHASGIVALMLSYANKNSLPNQLSHEDCEQLMQRNTTDITAAPNSLGYDNETGWGRLNAGAIFDSLWFPRFLVKHYQFTASASTATLVGFHEKTCLEQSLSGLPLGVTNVNRWGITANTSHTLPSGYGLIDAWSRGSGSTSIGTMSSSVVFCNGSTNANYLPAEHDAELNSFSSTGATMTGYIYELLDNTFNTVGWWPYDTTGTANFAYTLYLSDPIVGIEESKNELIFNIFPNPAKNTVTIKIGNDLSGEVNIVLTDLTGKLVSIISERKNIIAGQSFTFSVENFAQGMYFISLRNNQKQLTQKLLINH